METEDNVRVVVVTEEEKSEVFDVLKKAGVNVTKGVPVNTPFCPCEPLWLNREERILKAEYVRDLNKGRTGSLKKGGRVKYPNRFKQR